MNRAFILLLAVAFPPTSVFAQKVKVGYDKSVDFSKFATYSWLEPTAKPARPLLYASMVSYVDYEMDLKGLTRKGSDGDLILIPTGGVEFGLNGMAGTPFLTTYSGLVPTINATMWTEAAGASNVATWVSQGELVLTFVERSTNTEIWSGAVQEKLDSANQTKSLDLLYRAVEKLFKQFPPKRKGKA
jgi:Domain of unknown function (DUF4136)